MKFNNLNETEVKDLYVHDFILNCINYDCNMEKVSLDLLSTDKNLNNMVIIFKKVIFFSFQDCDFWLESYYKKLSDISVDVNKTYYKKLIDEYNKPYNKRSDYYPSKLCDENIEVVISTLTGGEIRIICSEMIVNELS